MDGQNTLSVRVVILEMKRLHNVDNCPGRLVVRTPAFQADSMSSILVRGAK